MSDAPGYVVLGRGRWAKNICNILTAEGCLRGSVESTRGESSEHIVAALRACGAQIAWLCVTPGPHVPTLIEAAIDAGLHVITEKPWTYSQEETRKLQESGRAKSLRLAIDYEYCLLDAVERWRREFNGGSGLQFGGVFTLARPSRNGIPALENLGSHLFSIAEYATPKATVREIRCGYELTDQRAVWLEKDGRRIDTIDLLASSEPVIQRFMRLFESAINGAEFPFDLDFAWRVGNRVRSWSLEK